MTWIDLSSAFAYGSQLTSTQMQQLRDNITALANGDSGAPAIQTAALDSLSITTAKIAGSAVTTAKIADGDVTEAKINNGAVTRNKLSTGTSSASGSISSGGYNVITMHDYTFFPTLEGNDSSNPKGTFVTFLYSTAGGYAGKFVVNNEQGGTAYYAIYWRYITATDKPFIFILRDPKSGKVQKIWVGDDPPDHLWKAKKIKKHEWPIIPSGRRKLIAESFFKTDQLLVNELRERSIKDKRPLFKLANDYQKSGNILVRKNLSQI